jgi:hypothetical protein
MHGGPMPHEHTPVAEQVSVLFRSQATHVAPLTPHFASVGGVVQLPLLQHPPGQVAGVQTQTPPLHFWPGPHAAVAPQVHAPFAQPSARFGSQAEHKDPMLPHEPTLGARQVFPLQHPVQPDWPSQMHAPLTHRWPAAHGWLEPH